MDYVNGIFLKTTPWVITEVNRGQSTGKVRIIIFFRILLILSLIKKNLRYLDRVKSYSIFNFDKMLKPRPLIYVKHIFIGRTIRKFIFLIGEMVATQWCHENYSTNSLIHKLITIYEFRKIYKLKKQKVSIIIFWIDLYWVNK